MAPQEQSREVELDEMDLERSNTLPDQERQSRRSRFMKVCQDLFRNEDPSYRQFHNLGDRTKARKFAAMRLSLHVLVFLALISSLTLSVMNQREINETIYKIKLMREDAMAINKDLTVIDGRMEAMKHFLYPTDRPINTQGNMTTAPGNILAIANYKSLIIELNKLVDEHKSSISNSTGSELPTD